MSPLPPTDPAVRTWVALLDAAEALRMRVTGLDPGSPARLRVAVDQLLKHEHGMTPDQRFIARRFVWLRDNPDPLPDDPTRFARCTCGACAFARRLARLRQTFPAAPVAAADTSPDSSPPEQGALPL